MELRSEIKENIKQKQIKEFIKVNYFSARIRLPWASPPELGPRRSRAGHIAAHSRWVVVV